MLSMRDIKVYILWIALRGLVSVKQTSYEVSEKILFLHGIFWLEFTKGRDYCIKCEYET